MSTPLYAHDPSLTALQDQARTQSLGLWADPAPVLPWEYRHGSRSTTSTRASCGHKFKCSQMASCRAACHYLNNCGVHTLDRDRDGLPCESICR